METLKHHEMTYKAQNDRMAWWVGETSGPKPARCPRCWLRPYQCYCEGLDKQIEALSGELSILSYANIEIIVYYNFPEIGRSANTAHIFHQLCPSISRQIILCDDKAEKELFNTLIKEKESGVEKTCVMYPSSSSIGFSSWVQGVRSHSVQPTLSTSPSAPSSALPSVRLIFLDGTYPGAARIAGFLTKARDQHHISLPFVQLDLHAVFGLRSAVAGIMYQPAKDKICTYQAIALALQQLLSDCQCSSRVVDMLLENLDKWIAYLLEKAIKHGKIKTKKSLKDIDNTPAKHMQEIMNARGIAMEGEQDSESKNKKAKTSHSTEEINELV